MQPAHYSLKRSFDDQAPFSVNKRSRETLPDVVQDIVTHPKFAEIREKYISLVMFDKLPNFRKVTRFYPPEIHALYEYLSKVTVEYVRSRERSYCWAYYPMRKALQITVQLFVQEHLERMSLSPEPMEEG